MNIRFLTATLTSLAMLSSQALAGDLRIVSWSTDPITCSYGSGDYPNNPIETVVIGYGAPWIYSPPKAAALTGCSAELKRPSPATWAFQQTHRTTRSL